MCDVLGQSRAGETKDFLYVASLCRDGVCDRNRTQDSGVLGSTREHSDSHPPSPPTCSACPVTCAAYGLKSSNVAPAASFAVPDLPAPSKACAVEGLRRRRRAVLKVEYPLPPRRPAASKQMQQARANGFSPRLTVRRPPFTLHPSPISGLRLRRLEVVHNNHDCDSEG